MQIHNLPVRRLQPETSYRVSNSVGRVMQVIDPDETGGGGNWLRVKVMIDVEEPFGSKISFDENSEVLISFKYERLSNFCYWCGCLSHTEYDCPTWLESQRTLRKEDQQFGTWLRASNDRPSRTVSITVEGEQSRPPHEAPANPQTDEWGASQTLDPDPPRVPEANPPVFNQDTTPPPNPANLPISRTELFELQLAEIDREIEFQAAPTTTIMTEVPRPAVIQMANPLGIELMDVTDCEIPKVNIILVPSFPDNQKCPTSHLCHSKKGKKLARGQSGTQPAISQSLIKQQPLESHEDNQGHLKRSHLDTIPETTFALSA